MIPINTNDNAHSKTDLWQEKIHSFLESGLSRKDWCLQNDIPQSTLGYWIRKFQPAAHETENRFDPVFAKLPSEKDLQSNPATENAPVTIHLPENIRIEICAGCPAGLMAALLQALKNYA